MSNRPWIALVGAAGAAAVAGWYTHARVEALGADAAVAGAVAEGFWLLALALGAIGVGAPAARYVYRVVRREREAATGGQFGQYTLEEKLGEGATGVVYRARHALLRRPTAIKVLHAERQSDTRAMRRFEREVQLTSRLMHHNTVAVYDYGRTADGVFYYAMELIDGVTLATLVDRVGPLPAARAMYILAQVCGSLHEAHEQGLIHRDIKPANVMLCEQGAEHDVVKVVDFGLVKDMDDGSSSLSRADALTGTPLYASPEAMRGAHEVEPRSDLYSLGAVAYYLVSGERVFDGETVMEVCSKHLTDEPIPPSLRVDGLDVPADLERLIMSCLAKRPADRPASAHALREALRGCADYGAWGQAEAAQWWSAHRADMGVEAAAPTASPALATLTIDLGDRR